MGPDDRFLLGTDLAKDASVLEAAYDDAQGVTARFNRNLLVRINRELGPTSRSIGSGTARSTARTSAGSRCTSSAWATRPCAFPARGSSSRFAEGESIHTENSHKYTPEALRELARRAGFVEEMVWTDARGWFRVQRWRTRTDLARAEAADH